MAQEIVMPKLGNTVESVVILEWRKNIGESIAVGEVLCEVETDKATLDVEAEIAGTLLARYYEADDEVAVLVPFAVIGEAGEDVSSFAAAEASSSEASSVSDQGAPTDTGASSAAPAAQTASSADGKGGALSDQAAGNSAAPGISPRARNLAASSGLGGLPAAGSGPGGRIIEPDVRAALEGRMPLTPAALAAGGPAPAVGTGIGGRVTAADAAGYAGLPAGAAEASAASRAPSMPAASVFSRTEEFPGPVESIPVKGVRKVIAKSMYASLHETAQLTLNSSANAAALLSWRAGFKNSPEDMGLSKISINDLVMYAVAKLLPLHPGLNAHFLGSEIKRFRHVHLGCAVDTPKGLMVPVIRYADTLSLSQLSAETRRLAAACRDGKALPDELSGGTFTVTNLGAFGIESFTPVLNAPEAAILGVGTITNAAVEKPDGSLGIEKRLGLSLTIDHQAVDGAPGARFLKDLSDMIAHLEWAMAL